MSGSVKRPEHALQRYILFGFVMLFVFLLQTVPGILPKLYHVAPLPLIPLAVIIAMYEGEWGGALFGLAAGLLMDTAAVHTAGFAALTLMATGCVCGLLAMHLMRNTILACVTLSAVASFAYCTLHWLFYYLIPGGDQPLRYFFTYSLLRAAYTAALCIPMYLLLRRFSRKKRKRRRRGG